MSPETQRRPVAIRNQPRGSKKVGRLRLAGLLVSSLVCLLSISSPAQVGTPHIGYVYPAGGQSGKTVQVKVGGQFLNGVTNVYVSGSGVDAVVVDYTKPLTVAQFNALREKLKALQDKRAAAARPPRRSGNGGQNRTNAIFTAEDMKTLADIRKQLANFQRRPPNPAIAETVTLAVKLASDAQPGRHELRLGTALGLSNPMVFCVGDLPEFRKTEPLKTEDAPANRQAFRAGRTEGSTPATETRITIPAVVNGQILPGGVDRFRFSARKGQRLVAAVSARDLIPYLADAVPGWFQATLTLYDAKGNELAYDDDFRFHPDPVLSYVMPKDGEYVIEIKDAIYRGREDFVYRIALGELPFVTGVFPLGAASGSETVVDLKGWNLPTNRLTEACSRVETGIGTLGAAAEIHPLNPVAFAVDTLPELLEKEPNNSADEAQAVTLPVVINGRIEKQGDADVFRFDGRAGDRVVAEVLARRLDSPLDSILRLTDANGKELAINDDCEDRSCGLNTHHADSYLCATLPSDGVYFVQLRDVQRQGGPEFAYRLRLSPPRPDFELRVAPASINARSGVSVPVTVYALRKDGFTNAIDLAFSDAPAGVTLSGGRIPANVNEVRVTIAASMRPESDPVNLILEGSAIVAGQRVVRTAVPAEDMMQAFAYRHLVPAQQLKLAVAGRFFARGRMRVLGNSPVRIPTGGTVTVTVAAPAGALGNRLQLELDNPPEGVELKKVTPNRDGAELLLACDASKLKPGLAGNLIVGLIPDNSGAAKTKKGAMPRRVSVGSLPAIPFEIVSP